MHSGRVLFKNARLTDDASGDLYDVLIDSGKVLRIAPVGVVEEAGVDGATVFDLDGQHVGE